MSRDIFKTKVTKEMEALIKAFEYGRVLMFDVYREADNDALCDMTLCWKYRLGRFLYEDADEMAETTVGSRPARRIVCSNALWYEKCSYAHGLLYKSRKELAELGWCIHRVYDGDAFFEQVEQHIVFVRKELDKKYLGFRRRGIPVSDIMSRLVWADIQGRPDKTDAAERVMNRSELDFELYDVVKDCINPVTGRPLVDFMASTLTNFYAFRNNDIDYDADASIEANIIYEKLFSFVNRVDKKVIRPQMDNYGRYNRYGLKFELGEPNCTGGLSYRGDTMNSVATTNRGYYWLHKEQQGGFVWPEEAIRLMEVYHTPGNFMVLPYREGFSINQARGKSAASDYFDLFLLAIYNFFLEAAGRQSIYGVTLDYVLKYNRSLVTFMTQFLTPFIEEDKCRFSEKDCQLIDDIADTSMLISNVLPGWEAFVEDNILQDFVNPNEHGHFGEPKELWKGHFTTYNKCNGKPYKEEQYFEFWTNAAEWIQRRSRRMFNICSIS